MPNIKGSSRNDVLTGSNSADRIQGMAGNDRLSGLGGNDTLEGGGGDDILIGGAGSDAIDGGLGIDTADYSGAAGPILVRGLGYNGDPKSPFSVEEYSAGGTLLSTDQAIYVENVVGTAYNDFIVGHSNANSLWGGAGDDRISGGDGNDRLFGGDGDDLLSEGNGIDYIDGGAGIDALFWDAGSPTQVIVDLQAGTVTYPQYGEVETVLNVENFRGSWGTKQVYGTDGANIVQGSSGDDLIDGRGGDDILVGDFGRSTGGVAATTGYKDDIRGGGGNDLISGDLDADILTGGGGADTFVMDAYYGTDRITDFEDGVDTLALYGGLTIAGWEARDTDGDGVADAMAALLSNGEAVLFEGYAAAPQSLVDATQLALHAEQFAIPELGTWSMADGWGGI